MVLDEVITGNNLIELRKLPSESVHAVITDPKYNKEFRYGEDSEGNPIRDNLPKLEYIEECRLWINECARVLMRGGAFVIIIDVENSHYLRILLERAGLELRNEIPWQYGFGEQTIQKYARCHATVLYYYKPGAPFTFNSKAILVPSDRQTIYNDKRASPEGKVPPDIFSIPLDKMKEPSISDIQLDAKGDNPLGDVWKVRRVFGTSKERIPGANTQLPEKLILRIVKALTNKGDVILDPHCGVGTVPYIAHLMGRHFITMELNPLIAQYARKRIKSNLQRHLNHSLPSSSKPEDPNLLRFFPSKK